MQKKIIAVGITAATFAPLFAFAAGQINAKFGPLINDVIGIVNLLVPFVLTLAVLFFFWGLAKFVLASGDEAARESGKSIMIWGVIAITVMVSLWGLVGFLSSLFGISTNAAGPTVMLPQ